jgi:dihydrofolate synthase/folylpolyglutamate synthase
MSYTAAVDHLLGLTPELSPTAPRRKFSLEHMRTLARALGDPQQCFPSILIAGTNGKGSTAATLASILTAAGLRTGLYTSPHLTRPTERIRVSSVPCSLFPDPCSLLEIPEEAFARLYFHVDSTANRLVTSGQLPHHPSFFETLTALSFLYFAEQHLDIAVLEVGLGGRLDATNIVSPLLSIITDIALDHQDYLGSTIAEIAREKAGILRAGGTLIALPQHPEANQAIGEAAIALNVRAISAAPYLPSRTDLEPRTSNLEPAAPLDGVISTEARSAQWRDPRIGLSQTTPLPPNHYDLHLGAETLHVRSPLPGEHQRRNLALAIAAAVEVLASNSSPLAPSSNLEPRTSNLIQAIQAGIAATSWPGRLEFLPPNLLLDVAHNPAGAWTLRAAIASLPTHAAQGSAAQGSHPKALALGLLESPRTLIFSCLRDKDLTEISRILFPLFDSSGPSNLTSNLEPRTSNPEPLGTPSLQAWVSQPQSGSGALAPGAGRSTHHLILTPIDNPRAASLDSLVAAARALSIPAHTAHSPTEALALARRLTPPHGLILATGSIYLIGALRQAALIEG